MPDGSDLRTSGGSGGNVAPLIRMLDMRLGHRTLRQFGKQLPCRPHFEDPVPFPYLDHRPCHRRRGGQPIEYPIVGEVAIPTDFAFFGGKTFPGKGLWQGSKWFLFSAIPGTFVGGAVDPQIDAFTPDVCLTIEIINIAEGHSCPIAVLEEANRALNFPFRLRRVRLADARCHPNGGHEIGKEGMPAWHLVL